MHTGKNDMKRKQILKRNDIVCELYTGVGSLSKAETIALTIKH